jgi:hypothetical protein
MEAIVTRAAGLPQGRARSEQSPEADLDAGFAQAVEKAGLAGREEPPAMQLPPWTQQDMPTQQEPELPAPPRDTEFGSGAEPPRSISITRTDAARRTSRYYQAPNAIPVSFGRIGDFVSSGNIGWS